MNPLDLGIECLSLNYWLGGNSRGARIIRGGLAARQRQRAYTLVIYWQAKGCIPDKVPIRVTLTRIMGPRQRAFDRDNLIGGMKHLRDGIAAAYRVDDLESERISWEYAQERGGKATVVVVIEKARK